MPPAGASTGRPAASAVCRVGAVSGSTADDADAAGVPGGDAADQPAAADRHQQRVDLRRVGLDLEPDRALAEQRLRLVVGVHRERAGSRDERLAGGERVGIDLAADHQLGAVAADALELGRRGDLGHEDRRAQAEPHAPHRRPRRRDCRPMPRRRRPAAPSRVSRLAKAPRGLNEPVCCRNSSLSDERRAGEAEIAGVDADDRRVPDIGPDQPLGRGDAVAVDGCIAALCGGRLR